VLDVFKVLKVAVERLLAKLARIKDTKKNAFVYYF